jgi:sulfonate transport system ATP-binding protein
MVHLDSFAHAFVHELSGGMKQRVAIARALAVDPSVLLMDEPFGALDAMTRDLLHAELQELWLRSRKTIVFVTHNVREAVVLGDRVLVMSPLPGRIVSEQVIDLPRPRRIEDESTMHLARLISASLSLAATVSHARTG